MDLKDKMKFNRMSMNVRANREQKINLEANDKIAQTEQRGIKEVDTINKQAETVNRTRTETSGNGNHGTLNKTLNKVKGGEGSYFTIIMVLIIIVLIGPILTFLFGNVDEGIVINNQAGFKNVALYTLGLLDNTNVLYDELVMETMQGEYLRLITYVIGFIWLLFLLFPPLKQIKSPLMFIGKQISRRLEKIKFSEGKNTEAVKSLIVITSVFSGTLISLLVVYRYIINGIIYTTSSAENGLINTILMGIAVTMTVLGTSIVVKRMQRNEEKNNIISEDYEKKIYINLGFLIIITIVGLLLSGYIQKQIKDSDLGQSINEIQLFNEDDNDGWIYNESKTEDTTTEKSAFEEIKEEIK